MLEDEPGQAGRWELKTGKLKPSLRRQLLEVWPLRRRKWQTGLAVAEVVFGAALVLVVGLLVDPLGAVLLVPCWEVESGWGSGSGLWLEAVDVWRIVSPVEAWSWVRRASVGQLKLEWA